MTNSVILIAVAGALASSATWADIRLPSLVGDGMVLQRDTTVTVWGWADPGETVTVGFKDDKKKVRTSKAGLWQVRLGPFPAGGPYDMSLKGRNTIALRDILVGDVWLASGQSNMEFPLKRIDDFGGVENADRELATASHPTIRLFKVPRKAAVTPQQDVEATTWSVATPETVANFSAVAYLFGEELQQRYQVPIGLIESSWGGTVAEAWIGEEGLKRFPEFEPAINSLKGIDRRHAEAAYENYQQWNARHHQDDLGHIDGRAVWAGEDFDVSNWPTVGEPESTVNPELNGFDGTVWYRKEVILASAQASKNLTINLNEAGQHDETYFNGEKVGETEGWDTFRSYQVPGRLVKAGRNVIAVCMTGSQGYVGFFSEPAKMSLEVGGTTVPLSGTWSFQPGPGQNALPASKYAAFNANPNTATLLYNGMIAPLTRYSVKGAIWYQGESNADRPMQYRTLFPALIADWRRRWGYEFPFLYVQLAGFGPNRPEPAEYPWAELREAQSLALSLPHTGMATAVDVGDEHDVHPKNKQDVAHRLVLAAAHVVYGENLVSSGPVYQSMVVEGGRLRIKFSHVGSGILIKDKYGYLRGFEIAGDDARFRWAKAVKDGSDVIVWSEEVLHPAAVRYDWSNTPDGNLYNVEGLPAVPFRTDGPH